MLITTFNAVPSNPIITAMTVTIDGLTKPIRKNLANFFKTKTLPPHQNSHASPSPDTLRCSFPRVEEAERILLFPEKLQGYNFLVIPLYPIQEFPSPKFLLLEFNSRYIKKNTKTANAVTVSSSLLMRTI